MNNKKLYLYLLVGFTLWSAYEILIYNTNIWLKHLLVGVVSLVLFLGMFWIIWYVMKVMK